MSCPCCINWCDRRDPTVLLRHGRLWRHGNKYEEYNGPYGRTQEKADYFYLEVPGRVDDRKDTVGVIGG